MRIVAEIITYVKENAPARSGARVRMPLGRRALNVGLALTLVGGGLPFSERALADEEPIREEETVRIDPPEGAEASALSDIDDASPKDVDPVAEAAPLTDFASIAAAVVAAGQDPVTIPINGEIRMAGTIDVAAGQDVTLVGSGSLVRDGSYVDLFFRVAEGGRLSIDGPTLDGSLVAGDNEGLIESEGVVELHDGLLTGIRCNGGSRDKARSAVYVGGENALFLMDGGTVSGNEYTEPGRNQRVGVVMAEDGASIEFTGGTISHNSVEVPSSAAVVVFGGELLGEDSSFRMGGTAEIADNVSYHGAVMLGDSHPSALFSEFGLAIGVMDGGTIARNTAQGISSYTKNYGGGIMVYYHASFTMNAGTISDNTGKMGAGVCATDGYVESGAYAAGMTYEDYQYYVAPGEFVMNGGEILRNEALGSGSGDEGCGGGVYAASNRVVIKAGTIADNKAGRQGGGIYLGCVPYVMHLYDALVTDNTADILGGGLWFCPTGDATNAVTNGGAIFGNSSLGAGDDFVSIPRDGKTNLTTLADRMLGGGEVAWHKDGGVETRAEADVPGSPDGSPRFDPESPGERLTSIEGSDAGYALKAVTAASAEGSARGHARLFVTGNHAPRGGGIGSNGEIIIGTPQAEYSLVVTKKWDPSVGGEDLEPVTVHLRIGDFELDSVTLEEANGWTASFEGLPDPGTLRWEYAVEESPVPEGFVPEYADAVIDHDSRTIFVEVSNTRESDVPVVPEEPEVPVDPEELGPPDHPESDLPGEGNPSGTEDPALIEADSGSLVRTGDPVLALMSAVTLLTATCTASLAVRVRRRS